MEAAIRCFQNNCFENLRETMKGYVIKIIEKYH